MEFLNEMCYAPFAMNNYTDEAASKLQQYIDQSKRIVFFGGAGVSTESGIPDFRSVDGLYNQKWDWPPEEILSADFFYKNTAAFYRFYREKLLVPGIRPNAAHIALARLEQVGKLSAVITQNIDGLHQAAGSKIVYELHGSTLRNYCTKCHQFFDISYVMAHKDEQGIPRCDECNAIIKPDVVLYGESLNQETIEKSVEAIRDADMLIIGGTSLSVYPAAGLIDYFRGAKLVLINRAPTPSDGIATLVIHESIGSVLGSLTI